MAHRSSEPALQSMIDAIDHIRSTLAGISLEEFEDDIDRHRIVERNVEIISEASRRLPDDLKKRHSPSRLRDRSVPFPRSGGAF